MVSLSRQSVYHGPNPHAAQPIVVCDLIFDDLDLAEYRHAATMLRDCLGRSTPAASELKLPIDAESVVEYILGWSLLALTCVRGFLTTTGYVRLGQDRFQLWIGFHEPDVSYAALEIAADSIGLSTEGVVSAAGIEKRLRRLWEDCQLLHPDTQTRIMMEGAVAKNIPVQRAWDLNHYWQYGWGQRSQVMFQVGSNHDGYVSGQVISQKHDSKKMIASLGLPTPNHALLRGRSDIGRAIETIGFPCVIKPVDRGGGKGVSAGLKTAKDALRAFDYARRFSGGPILFEEFVEGSDHRLVVIDGQFISALRRDPPKVVGDGTHTIRELIEDINRSRSPPGVISMDRLDTIVMDDECLRHLGRRGVSMDTVLPPGEEMDVRGNANVSTGGSCSDVTAEVHPDVRAAAELLARTLAIRTAGLDYLTTDISSSWRGRGGSFIELNLMPGLESLTLIGWAASDVGRLVLGSHCGRIPLELIVVADDAMEQTGERLTELFTEPGDGWASHDIVCVDQRPIPVATVDPWQGVKALLSYRTVNRAALLVSSSLLLVHGLPVDRADRIWLCTPDLPKSWQDVLERASTAPLWRGSFDEFRTDYQPQPPSGSALLH